MPEQAEWPEGLAPESGAVLTLGHCQEAQDHPRGECHRLRTTALLEGVPDGRRQVEGAPDVNGVVVAVLAQRLP